MHGSLNLALIDSDFVPMIYLLGAVTTVTRLGRILPSVKSSLRCNMIGIWERIKISLCPCVRRCTNISCKMTFIGYNVLRLFSIKTETVILKKNYVSATFRKEKKKWIISHLFRMSKVPKLQITLECLLLQKIISLIFFRERSVSWSQCSVLLCAPLPMKIIFTLRHLSIERNSEKQFSPCIRTNASDLMGSFRDFISTFGIFVAKISWKTVVFGLIRDNSLPLWILGILCWYLKVMLKPLWKIGEQSRFVMFCTNWFQKCWQIGWKLFSQSVSLIVSPLLFQDDRSLIML